MDGVPDSPPYIGPSHVRTYHGAMDPDNDAQRAPSAPSLSLEALVVGTLDPVSLDIAPGQVLALSGASGSGKSRLLRAIADLDDHGGRVRLGGQWQNATQAHRWRRQVMLVPADSQWWADRVGAHFPAPATVDWAAAGFTAAVADWEVARLSSGERQRLALLRAVAHGPSALLLDEPTANLDEETTARIEAWLLGLIRTHQWPTVWVSHDPAQIARVADHQARIRATTLEIGPCR